MTLTDYEIARQRRIQENKARMEAMGLAQTVRDISHVQTAAAAAARAARAARSAHAAERRAANRHAPRGPRRRSERAAGMAAPVYNERALALLDAAAGGALAELVDRRDRRTITENVNEEAYTAEHLAALGSTAREWELFVDGYDSAGNRVYDKVSGQTCHQCRQKTLGKRTACSECGALTGVLCGDCLYMRYGEHVEEAAADAGWRCPHCRGLCNCSFHRLRRGWAPTGSLYRRASAAGYASVAHFLVLNNLEPGARPAAEALGLAPALMAEVRAAWAAADAAAAERERQRAELQAAIDAARARRDGSPAPEAAAAGGLLEPDSSAGEAPARRGRRGAAAAAPEAAKPARRGAKQQAPAPEAAAPEAAKPARRGAKQQAPAPEAAAPEAAKPARRGAKQQAPAPEAPAAAKPARRAAKQQTLLPVAPATAPAAEGRKRKAVAGAGGVPAAKAAALEARPRRGLRSSA